jgi:4-diphosphocytidyl-2-C-methyl-D-erythritol kinase
MRQYKGRARAKLNLYLEVGPRREDGYHDLCTVFQTIDLYDKVAITVHDKGGISLKCNWPYLPTDSRNLAYRAAELFFAHTGKDNPGIYINMKKVIPVGAGMAGGSTDAATVLRLLNRAFGYPLSKRELLELGLQLGADVPFCLTGGTMLAEGVGEQLSPLPDLPPCGIVVCKPGFSVATKKAYELFDACAPEASPGFDGMRQALEQGDLDAVCGNLFNSLEAPVVAEYPPIGTLIRRLQELGALGVRMTGSGAACFGIWPTVEEAEAAAAELRKRWAAVFVTTPVPADELR